MQSEQLVRRYLQEFFRKSPEEIQHEYQKIVSWAAELKHDVLDYKRRIQRGVYDTQRRQDDVANTGDQLDRDMQKSLKFLEKNIETLAEDPKFEATWQKLEAAQGILHGKGIYT